MKKNQFQYRLPDYTYFINKVLFEMPMGIGQKYDYGFYKERPELTNDDKIKEELINKCKNQIDNAIINFLGNWENNFDKVIITGETVDKLRKKPFEPY